MAAVMQDEAVQVRYKTCGANTAAGHPCRNPAGKRTDHLGYGTCYLHGGRTRNHTLHARQEAAEAAVLRLAGPNVELVHNPTQELQRLAGDIRAWQRAARSLVDGLNENGLIVATGDDVHPLVKLAERADDRLHRVLAEMAKLGIEERRIEIDQATQQALYATLTAVLTDAGYDPGRVLPELGSRLRALDTGGAER